MGEEVIIWLTLKSGLVLTDFRTILPCFQQVNLTWASNPIENQPLVSGQLQNKPVTLMSSKPEPAIWSRDSGQRISWSDSCQLNIIWMSNIKDIWCNPRLHDLVLAGWPPCCATSSSSSLSARRPYVIHAASHLDHKKEFHGFLFLCIHVVLFLSLWCSASRPFRPPELRYENRCNETSLDALLLYFLLTS